MNTSLEVEDGGVEMELKCSGVINVARSALFRIMIPSVYRVQLVCGQVSEGREQL